MNEYYIKLHEIVDTYDIKGFWDFWNKISLLKQTTTFYKVRDMVNIWKKRYDLNIYHKHDQNFVKMLYQTLIVNKKNIKHISIFKDIKIVKYLLSADNKKYNFLLNIIDRINQIINLNLDLDDLYDIDDINNKIIVLNEQMFLEKNSRFLYKHNIFKKISRKMWWNNF